jgi:hypothetical protein
MSRTNVSLPILQEEKIKPNQVKEKPQYKRKIKFN